MVHHVGPAADGGQWEAPAEDLAEAREVGCQSEAVLRPAQTEAEPGDDLVEDEQGARLGAPPAQVIEEAVVRRDEPHVGRDALDDDRGDLAGVPLEHGVDGGRVVERNDDRVRHGRRRHPHRSGQAEGGHTASRRGQQGVEVAVVAPGELHDLVAAGVATGEAHGGHRRLGARADQPHLVDGGDEAADRLGHLDLALGGRSIGRPGGGGPAHRVDQGRVGVAEDRRPPRLHVVAVTAAIGVDEIGPLGGGDEEGLATDGAERPHGRVDAAGDPFEGPAEEIHAQPARRSATSRAR